MSNNAESKAVGDLGRRVEARVKALGITPSAAGDLAGLDRSLVRFLISGRTNNPRMDTLVKLARALDCSLDYLFGFSEDVGAPGDPVKSRRPAIDRMAFERIAKALSLRAADMKGRSGETLVDEALRYYDEFEAEADMNDAEEIELRIRLIEKSIEKARR